MIMEKVRTAEQESNLVKYDISAGKQERARKELKTNKEVK